MPEQVHPMALEPSKQETTAEAWILKHRSIFTESR